MNLTQEEKCSKQDNNIQIGNFTRLVVPTDPSISVAIRRGKGGMASYNNI